MPKTFVMTTLFVVPTPIGNLDDITIRAVRILKEADFVLAEDTRTSGILLKHLGLSKKLIPYHQFNEHRALENIISMIRSAGSAAMISDAGTPGISDAGFLLIRACIQSEIDVVCLPGPTAFVPALVASGLACDRFFFEGFLPHKKGRLSRLQYLATLENTVVLYESPHRIAKCIEQLCEVFGENRNAVIAREISKIHEEYIRGSLGELKTMLSEKSLKGEIVVLIEGQKK